MNYTERDEVPDYMINREVATKYASLVEKLDNLQASENDGEGITTVQSIVKLLRMGNVEGVRRYFAIDGG